MAGKNCKCHQIGKTMAKKTSRKKMSVQTVGGITVGIAAGAIGIPKVVAMVDPSGNIDPKIINGVGAAGAWYFSTQQSGFIQSALQGLAAGLAWNVISNVAGIGAPDYTTQMLNQVAGPTTDRLNQVAGGAI